MKITALFILAYVIGHLILVYVHIQCFQSPVPMLAGLTVTVHLVLLIIFPPTIFKNQTNKNENKNTL